MAALQFRDAAFSGGPLLLLQPKTLVVECGERAQLQCESGRAAGIAANLAAGIMRCTSGIVFVGDFDPKIQPVQAKRMVGFVPHDPPCSPLKPAGYFAYRAALWGLQKRDALTRGAALLAAFDGLPGAEALALAGALLHKPQLVILDRPSNALRSTAEAVLNSSEALFVTYGPGSGVAPLHIQAAQPVRAT